jgi:hypothetical protein
MAAFPIAIHAGLAAWQMRPRRAEPAGVRAPQPAARHDGRVVARLGAEEIRAPAGDAPYACPCS